MDKKSMWERMGSRIGTTGIFLQPLGSHETNPFANPTNTYQSIDSNLPPTEIKELLEKILEKLN